MLRPYPPHSPQIDATAFVDDTAVVIGDVVIGEQSSVWMNAVIRGDVNSIHIGKRSSIQDLSMLHGCTIGSHVLVGMHSTILDDAIIEDDVMIGAASLVPPRKRLESGYLYMGSPVQKVRELTVQEKEFLRYSANHYVKLAATHQASLVVK